MAGTELDDRLARIEETLRALRVELDEVRRLAAAAPRAATPVPEPTPPPGLVVAAWRELERGREAEALALAERALRAALRTGDDVLRADVSAFAQGAANVVDAALLQNVLDLARRAAPGAPEAPPPRPAPAPAPARAPAPPRARPHVELTDARVFALAGGVVTLLGIVFLFVLAANRGWIGPVARVSIGAAASLAVLTAGVVLRARFGRLQASLAAVGTGIAGAYATEAAATIVYGFLPNWVALLVAAAIAAVGAGLALAWSSELLAGLSLVGAAAAPALVAFDDGIGAAGTAFAVIVLAASLAAAAPRRWLWLAVAVGTTAIAQVGWLVSASPAADAGAVAVVAAAAVVLLAGGLAWQATARAEGLDATAGSLVLAAGGLALGGLSALLADPRDAGTALAVAAAVAGATALGAGRRFRDLGWVVAAVALLLAGIATADLLSQRSLTIAWAVEAAALAVPARRLRAPRFELASLGYLALGALHALAVDLQNGRPPGDVPTAAAAGTYSVAAAALVVAVLAPETRGDPRSPGLLASLEPLWDGIVASRGTIRMWLWGAAVALGAFGTAALASGRTLTLAFAGAAVVLAAAAHRLGERRLQAAALAVLALAAGHALVVEARPDTLVLGRELDPLRSVPSLLALAVAAASLAALSGFPTRGIAFLGPLAAGERVLLGLGQIIRVLRAGLAVAAATYGVWALGLVAVEASYDAGQLVSTGLWATAATVAAAAAARRRAPSLALVALAPALFAYAKAADFDWKELTPGWAAAALVLAAAGVLLYGFCVRFAAADLDAPLEAASGLAAVVAVASTVVAVDHVAPDRTRLLGAGALAAAVVVAALAVPPYRLWRSGRPLPWLRDLATAYWLVALVSLFFAEATLIREPLAVTVAAWAATAALTASLAEPLAEERLWDAGATAALGTTLVCLSAVTPPSRLVLSSAHPGAELWALAVCILALAWLTRLTPDRLHRTMTALGLLVLGLAVFALSLGVLESAERISSASVDTDFQRGHTAVSALWGTLALGVFVAGLLRGRAAVQRLGLVLFGLALAKLFLYDLRSLSSITRALSFLAVGAILLTAAFFAERLVHRGGGPGRPVGPRPA